MAITYVGQASASSTSVSLPSFSAGDLAIVVALNGTSTTVPTVPTGWTALPSAVGASMAGVFGYRWLQIGDTTTGTWTNAGKIEVVVYGGVLTSAPFAWPTATYPAISVGSSGSPGGGVPALQDAVTLAVVLEIDQNVCGDASFSGWTKRGSGAFGCWDRTTTGTISQSVTGAYVVVSFGLRAADATISFPLVSDGDTTSGTVTSNSSSWTLTYPTNIAAGDLLLAFVGTDGSTYTGGTWPAGWVGRGANGNSACSLLFAKKKADGTETGTFTLSIAAAEQGSWIIYRIPVGTWEGTLGSEFTNVALADSVVGSNATGGASSNPDPADLDPNNWGTENALWFAFAASDTSRTYSAYPSSPDTFTNTGYLASGGSTGATVAWARLEKNAASVDPGTFTHSASDDWAAATIAVRPYTPAVIFPRVNPYLQLLAH